MPGMFDPGQLINRYYVMRHGHSEANERGVIVSHSVNGAGQFGLTAVGRMQVAKSLDLVRASKDPLDDKTRIFSSDFRRAVETATIARDRLGVRSDITLDTRLRERDFGELELASSDHYDEVWASDEQDSANTLFGAESADAVLCRGLALVTELEKANSDTIFLFVSHGDTLQILMTAFMGLKTKAHRRIRHLETAEIRCLNSAS